MPGWALDNAIGVTQQMQAVLEERWFQRHQTLKLFQIDGSLQQLPVRVVREVSEHKLRRRRHEVILIQLIAHVLQRRRLVSLTHTRITTLLQLQQQQQQQQQLLLLLLLAFV